MAELVTHTHDFSKCPRCGYPMRQTPTYSGAPSRWWLECSNKRCNTFINTYTPQEHQADIHRDAHLYMGNFGGYGSGKTTNSQQEQYKHCFITPNGNSLIAANITPQYEQTIKRDIEADLPAAFIREVSNQKAYMDLVNGHRILYRPLDDPDKLRSLNLSHAVILEASETPHDAFIQLQTRVRNAAAFINAPDAKPGDKPLADWRKIIIESNPDAGWIRSNFLLISKDVYRHGTIKEHIPQLDAAEDDNLNALNPQMSSHITATNANKFLPADFMQTLARNKPQWWINRFLFGSFNYAVGLVYPTAMDHVIATSEVPRNWKRQIAFDYGLSDKAVYLFAAIHPEDGTIYIYKEVVTEDNNIVELARKYHENVTDIPSGGMYQPPIIDPKSGVKRDYNKKTLIDHFLDYGISFQPGHIQIDARVFRTNTFFEMGKIKIMDCCKYLISELRDYKYKEDKNSSNQLSNKPEDKNNHAINPLEWICMSLPADPTKIVNGVYNRYGENLTRQEEQHKRTSYWALSEPTEQRTFGLDENNIFQDGGIW